MAFDEFVMVADGTGGTDALGFVFAPVDLDGVIEVFFEKPS